MKKKYLIFSFLTVFAVLSMSAGNIPVPSMYSFKKVNNELLKETKLSTKEADNTCTATTTCPNGTIASYTAATCAEASAVIIAWLKNGGCQ